MSEAKPSADETGLLKLAQSYGDGLDISGPRIPSRVRAAARECVRKGWLSGKPKSYSLTETGRLLLSKATGAA